MSHTQTLEGPITVRALPLPVYALNALAVLAIGIMVLAWPKATLAIVAVLFGLHLILLGVLQVVAALKAPISTGLRALVGILGAFLVVAGIICVLHPFTSLGVLVILIAAGWIADAIAGAISGAGARGGARWGSWVLAAISLAAAVVLLVWPKLTLLVMVKFAGWMLVLFAVIQLLDVIRLWRADSKA